MHTAVSGAQVMRECTAWELYRGVIVLTAIVNHYQVVTTSIWRDPMGESRHRHETPWLAACKIIAKMAV